MGGILQTIRNAWMIPDLRKKLFYTMSMLLVFRLGAHIPVPGLDASRLEEFFKGAGGVFELLNTFSGGALGMATIFAMSISPYINASIIMQLLTVAIPRLERLAKEGEEGRKIIGQYVRYGTVVLGFLQASGLYWGLTGFGLIDPSQVGAMSYITITLTFTAGTAFLMWLGEQITENGIGNGISLIIFAGILARARDGFGSLYTQFVNGSMGEGLIKVISLLFVIGVFVAIIAAIVWVQQAERRIPVQYAKRVVGQKVYGGQKSHIPLKVNLAGVIPIIFAMSFVALPSTIVSFVAPDSTNWFVNFIKGSQSEIGYAMVFAIFTGVLVMFFTFFYTFIQFNPVEIANNMKKNGGFIPGIRPGKPTSEYIMKVLNRITWFSAIFLALIQVLPTILQAVTALLAKISSGGVGGSGLTGVWFAGTSALILVGVALDTVKQIESQMLMRHYKGFLE